MLVWYVLFTIFSIMISIYIGLMISEQVKNNKTVYIFFWVIYVVLVMSVLNGLMVANFWSVLQNKQGPPGPRGIIGDIGERGYKGECRDSCRGKNAVRTIHLAIINELNKLENRKPNNLISEIDIKNKVILDKINVMAQSKEFELGSEVKGSNNMANYLAEIWREWIRLIYQTSRMEFISNVDAEDNFNWTKTDEISNPFEEMRKYDIYFFGLNKEFRPAKFEICANPEETNYLPEQPKARLQTIIGNYYTWQFYDVKRADSYHISFWKPSEYNTGDFNHENERYYPLGDVAYIYYGGNTETIPESVFKLEDGSIHRKIGSKSFNIPKPPDVIPYFEFYTLPNYAGKNVKFRAFDKYINLYDYGFGRATYSLKIPSYMTFRRGKKIDTIQLPGAYAILDGYHEERRQYLTLYNDTPNLRPYNYIRWKWGIDGMKDDQQWDYKAQQVRLYSCSYQGNDGGPNKEYLLVSGDVKPPIDFELVYTEKNRCNVEFTIWLPIAPKNYVVMGFVCHRSLEKPQLGETCPIRCLPMKCLYQMTQEPKILWTSPKGSSEEVVQLVGYSDSTSHIGSPSEGNAHLMVQIKRLSDPMPKFYYINMQCANKIDNTKAKMPEKMNTDLSIGWHGQPTRQPKYSIFSFLQTMPEAIITNKYTNRKYYIRHANVKDTYNTKDFQKVIAQNYYLVLKYNTITRKYDRAIATSGSNDIKEMKASTSDIRQLWIIELLDGGEMRLLSKETGKYLSHESSENLRGNPIEKQVDNPPLSEDKTIFINNKSAFGTAIHTMKETKKHVGLRDNRLDITQKDRTFKGRQIKGIYNPK